MLFNKHFFIGLMLVAFGIGVFHVTLNFPSISLFESSAKSGGRWIFKPAPNVIIPDDIRNDPEKYNLIRYGPEDQRESCYRYECTAKSCPIGYSSATGQYVGAASRFQTMYRMFNSDAPDSWETTLRIGSGVNGWSRTEDICSGVCTGFYPLTIDNSLNKKNSDLKKDVDLAKGMYAFLRGGTCTLPYDGDYVDALINTPTPTATPTPTPRPTLIPKYGGDWGTRSRPLPDQAYYDWLVNSGADFYDFIAQRRADAAVGGTKVNVDICFYNADGSVDCRPSF